MRQLKISKQITNRETPSLDKYLQEISKVDLITAEMEVDLTQRVRQGDMIAMERLVKANLRFVVSVAKQYQNHGLPLGDLINEGNVGLIKAVMRFDETRGFKLISYAVWWIRQAILQALIERSRIVRLPLNRINSINKMSKAFAELEQRFQREPSVDELAHSMGVTAEDVKYSMQVNGRHVSVDAPFVQGEENNLLDVLTNDELNTPDSNLMVDSLKRDVSHALAALPQRESEIISCYFGLNDTNPMTLGEIGERFNLTPERVRQLKEKATRRLQGLAQKQLLQAYLG